MTLLVAASAVGADGSVAYLIPMRPTEVTDAWGAQWEINVIGYNGSDSPLSFNCADLSNPCRPLPAKQAFFIGRGSSVTDPLVLRIPASQSRDVFIEEQVMGIGISSEPARERRRAEFPRKTKTPASRRAFSRQVCVRINW